MHHENHDNHNHGSLKSYVIGFILSIVLTIIPLVLVMNHMLEKTALVITIMVMAILQFIVQLFFFMHIREGEKPRYNVQTLILGLVIVFTIVAGSIWIMTFNKY
ncbi:MULTISPECIES: cytochrome o ubiquinol oxidase subunit IV [Brevibacillus]|jgi:cytochrome o ubiquinol oxidase operon protein cyoD|uniref:Quinol oxidase polypeptide IV n=1 Tax=Brevibacillus borstelensis AK1 TaxID=1300222 RepID=M8DI44_9BACL|nr:cytochrome o ubiquinol oxidase subunit IV [Brevibacillus borstelensis]EMT53233.1 quinol oxidase polypeptide IV [Brevibacillus borstelensis AK1]KKX55380.1 heme transporter CcmD [Brevibacillus borstelensis cifa_chp40]MBE5397658.1 cytochrome o ubiquinol oxidase subunit IV [Brevibacillus borstelensis]MCC0563658.1 cytochrome o ubiquinol oxidase subunit IV [Brevibacillus borstelensis]MCM3469302.1 cytochrome o ubiquinol oxidase subunit IV [Brevibacillus borstelensis]